MKSKKTSTTLDLPYPLLRFLLNLTLFSFISPFTFSQDAHIPAELLAIALNHAQNQPNHFPSPTTTITQLQNGNIDTLYQVAKSLYTTGTDGRVPSVLILHELADGNSRHVLSAALLGTAYSEEDKPKAAKYFVQAGEDGPHHGSLYNAGRLFLEMEEWTKALAYFRAGAILHKTDPKYARERITTISHGAYETLSKNLIGMLSGELFGVQLAVDLFPYADIEGFPEPGKKEDGLWDDAVRGLQAYGKTKDRGTLEGTRKIFSQLEDNPESSLLQKHLLKGLKTQILLMLKDDNDEL